MRWILLGNKLKANFFHNRKIVQYIRHADGRHIFIHFSDVSWNFTKETTLPGLGKLWFDEIGIYNILSFIKAKEKHGVWYYHDEYIFTVLNPIHAVLFNPRVGGI